MKINWMQLRVVPSHGVNLSIFILENISNFKEFRSKKYRSGDLEINVVIPKSTKNVLTDFYVDGVFSEDVWT